MDTTKVTLEDLPMEIGNIIFSILDVPSMCRLYITFSSSLYGDEIAQFLQKCKVNVTAATIVTGDTTNIDFDTLAKLPPCDIAVNFLNDYSRLTLWHLERLSYRLVAVTISGEEVVCSQYLQPDLNFLGARLTELNLINIDIEPEKIPSTITKLDINLCRNENPLNLEKFNNLTHLSIENIDNDEGKILPHRITDLHFCSFNDRTLDASALSNLRRYSGTANIILPRLQLEVSDLVTFSQIQGMDQMKQISIVSNDQSFKDIRCPRLESVEYIPNIMERHPPIHNVTELFTTAQLARLIFLKGAYLMIDDIDTMSLLQLMTVLHVRFNATITEDLPLPPKLVEFSIKTSQPVKGVPPQLKVFACQFEGEKHDVVVKSSRLKSLRITGSKSVTIDCHNLTDLHLEELSKIYSLDAPNLTKLNYKSRFPFPFDKFPRLTEVNLHDAYGVVEINHRLKSFKLWSSHVRRVSILADTMYINSQLPSLTNITATVLQCDSSLHGVRGITCQELICRSIDRVPSMVEKVTLENNIGVEELLALKLNECPKLKNLSLKLDHGKVLHVPPSVKHLKVEVDFLQRQRNIEIKTQRRLVHLKVVNIKKLKLTETLVSLYVNDVHLWFRPELIKLGKPSKKRRLQ